MTNSFSAALYDKSNEQIEQMCEIMYFVMTKLTAIGSITPLVLLTIVNYFVYDLRDESYLLLFPVMCVYISTKTILVNVFWQKN